MSAYLLEPNGRMMERFREILLAVWREACQHIEINESIAGIAELLAAHVPLDFMTVERIVPEHQLIASVAAAPHQPPSGMAASRECTPEEMKKLLAWIKLGKLSAPYVPGGAPEATLDVLAIPRGAHDVRVAPLASRGEAVGALVVAAKRGERFTLAHEEMLSWLQEPLAVALENDRRLHELAALREAAEADRRSLLRRLGRQEINDHIVGEKRGLAPVMKRVDLVCSSDAPVLLLGETGTGKEVVARAIHMRGDRRDGPFIRVNCGAIPPELVDSQLFGHEKGSFTGASETRQGWFERADGGTLFLDEIGELPHDAQVRFLRVLQDSFVERVGGREPIRVDVRVIAATHRDLSAMVRQGKFREDLWYRIAVFPILLPPLRERLTDIPELAGHFAERAAVRFSLAPVMPTIEDIETLRSYSWPGNIRELGAVIDRAAILGEGRTLELAAALGFSVEQDRRPHGEHAPSPGLRLHEPVFVEGNGSIGSLDDAVRQHIRAALKRARGRIEGPRGVAAMLEINPHTLRARMRKLGIDWSEFRED
ncbi:transcriptional regulator [Lacipirellula parvula]|uniref:Transcriptional regulator n=2 Tax=Lacipirellula parvula TaxID=2650471 RepID=A0A5K7XJ28_9BACT|nr:transcriptional regulator [Lacipirellula parvula]